MVFWISMEIKSNPLKKNKNWIMAGLMEAFSFLIEKSLIALKIPQTVLEKEPLDYLSKKSQLYAIKHKGFWYSIDTVRDKKYLESLIKTNKLPWEKL